MQNPKNGLIIGSLLATVVVGVLLIQTRLQAQTAQPTVDIKVNGSDGPVNLTAPASYTVSWTSASTTACSTLGTAGSQMGTANTSLNGSQSVSGQVAGSYTYTSTCGSASDSVTVTVSAPVTPVYSGFCMVRNSSTSITMNLPYPDLGTGYAKIGKGSVPDITTLRADCTDADYAALLTSYCTINSTQVQREVVMYDANNHYYSNGGSAQGSSYISCPTNTVATSTPPTTPTGLTASLNGNNVVLSWVDNSSNETGFKIYRYAGGLWTDMGNVAANTTIYTDSATAAGSTYSYHIQAFVQPSGQTPVYSPPSSDVTITVPTGNQTTPVPTVSLLINGSHTTSTFTAPANFTVSWTSTNVNSCNTTGAWAGSSQGPSGSTPFSNVTTLGTSSYGLACTGGSSSASDSVSVNIVAPNSSNATSTSSGNGGSTAGLGSGACIIRDSYTNMPSANTANFGTGYGKVIKPGVTTIIGLEVACNASDYQNLLQTYCATNHNQVQQEVVTYDNNGNVLSTSCGPFGCSYIACPTTTTATTTPTTVTTPPSTSTSTSLTMPTSTSTTPTTTQTATAPSAPANLVANGGPSNIVLTWTDTSNNENGFKLYKTVNGLWTDIGNVSANTTSYTDNNIVSGSSYSYKVQSFIQQNGATPLYSVPSNIVTVTAGAVTASSTTPTMLAVGSVSGNVTDATGQPVANAGVNAYNTQTGQNFSALSGSSGSYALSLPGGSYTLGLDPFPTGRSDLIKPQSVTLNINGSGNQTQNLQFLSLSQNAKTVTGSVKFSDGSAVTDAQVGAYNQLTGQWLTAQTKGDGSYSLNVGGGAWQLSAKPLNPQTALWQATPLIQTVTFQLDNSAEAQTINFVEQKAQTVATISAVDDNGQPLPGVGIVIDSNSTAGAGASATAAGSSATTPSAQYQKTDSSGHASFNLIPGNYYLRGYLAAGQGLTNPAEQPINVNGSSFNAKLVFNHQTVQTNGTLSGTVILPDGSAAGGATVWAWSDQNGQAGTTADQNGSFNLSLAFGTNWHIGAGKLVNNIAYKSSEAIVNFQTPSSLQLNLLAVSAAPLPQPVTVTQTAGLAILGQSQNGAAVAIPPSSVSAVGTVNLSISPTVAVPAQSNAHVVGTAYDINLKDASGNSITKFSNTIEVDLPYNDSDLNQQGTTADKVAPSYYDDAAGTWVKVSDFTLDKTKKLFILRVNHLTRFALVAPASVTPPQSPSNALAWLSGVSEVSLSWIDPKIDFHHSRVLRAATLGGQQSLLQDLITTGNFKDDNVSLGQTYYYYVQAVDAAGNQSSLTQPLAVAINGQVQAAPGAAAPAPSTFSTGDLVLDNGAIYYILSQTKIAFTSMKAFKGLGYVLKNVIAGDTSSYSMDQTFLLSSASQAHPWGTWVKTGGTTYYNSAQGFIRVPSTKILLANGGKTKNIVTANRADLKLLKAQKKLPALVANDPRVL